MNKGIINWLLFILLSIIWGSSFIMMKEGLLYLTAYQLAALRILFSGIILLPWAIKYFKEIPKNKIGIIFLSGVLGSLLPAFLFCIAEEGIDGALAGTLNSLTPIFVIIVGALFFKNKVAVNKIFGICIAFTGSILLLLSHGNILQGQNLMYLSFVILATICYGINVNMVHKYLQQIAPLKIAAVALSLNALLASIILMFTGYFKLNLSDHNIIYSTFHAALLGVFASALASIIFYNLIKRAGTIFASMVTYGIPFIANAWGVIYGEKVGLLQIVFLFIILAGVWLTNKKVN